MANALLQAPTSTAQVSVVGQIPAGTAQVVQLDSSGKILISYGASAFPTTDAADGALAGSQPGYGMQIGFYNGSSFVAASTATPLPCTFTGSAGNAAASATGSAVPSSADYLGVNISGNLVGVTGFSLTNSKAVAIAIVDGSGNQITSFGGGTQFADNAASGATPTGTLHMGWDSANSKVRALKVDASQNLNVNLAANSNGSIAVTGTFWQTTQPVSGTFWQATQPVSGTVAVTGTFWQTTQPVSGTVTATVAAVGATGSAVPASAAYNGAIATTSYPTAASNGNLVGLMSDKAGRLAVVLNAPRDLIGSVAVQSTSGSLASLIAAGATGVFNDIVSATFTNEAASATIVSLSDGTTTYKFALAANGGGTFSFPTPLPATSSATAWQVSNSAPNNVDCVVIYVKNK